MTRLEFTNKFVDINFDKSMIRYFDKLMALYNLMEPSYSKILYYELSNGVYFNVFLQTENDCSILKTKITPYITLYGLTFEVVVEQNKNILQVKMNRAS